MALICDWTFRRNASDTSVNTSSHLVLVISCLCDWTFRRNASDTSVNTSSHLVLVTPCLCDWTFRRNASNTSVNTSSHLVLVLPCLCSQSMYYPTNALLYTTQVTYINCYMFRHRGTILRELLQQSLQANLSKTFYSF
jgi:hypothetical protein